IFMPWRFSEYQFPRAKPQREMKKSFEIIFLWIAYLSTNHSHAAIPMPIQLQNRYSYPGMFIALHVDIIYSSAPHA
ncbi:MAG TPA: hypothetical protein PKA26_05195, partial [bacterium]|nr:hypothetical protein [bacterium]